MIRVLTTTRARRGGSLPLRVFVAVQIHPDEVEPFRRNFEFHSGEATDEDFWKTMAAETARNALEKWGYEVLVADPGQCHVEDPEKFGEITAHAESIHRSGDGRTTVWKRDEKPD